MTTPRSTSADCAVWKSGSIGPAGFCHNVFPVFASNAVTMPLMPRVNRRPSAYVGVDFGPGPWRAVA
jgi:hypothetical protein